MDPQDHVTSCVPDGRIWVGSKVIEELGDLLRRFSCGGGLF